MDGFRPCHVTAERLTLGPLIDHVSDPDAGAVATFLGVSRRRSNERRTCFAQTAPIQRNRPVGGLAQNLAGETVHAAMTPPPMSCSPS